MTVEDTTRDAQAESGRLIANLENPRAFDHPLRHWRLIETHVSWVILTGEYAYKVKKPVDFGFLDFTTLSQRRFYCEEELRLNRRFAPEIYLGLAEIRGSVDRPRFHGAGEVIEYAVKMRQFEQRDLLSALAAEKRLDAAIIDAMAASISAVHAACEPAPGGSDYGSAAVARRWSDENLSHLQATVPPALMPAAYGYLVDWYRQNRELEAVIEQRKRDGFVRECHGDLHLGNMALIAQQVTLFDCLEFNPELRWIDVVSEAAFVAMDLQARGYPEFCWRFVNRYLQAGGDYSGVRLLRYYFIYRALVRAKVEALRSAQHADELSAEIFQPAFEYLDLAHRWARSHRAGLIVMHGLSGSGKSTVAAQLAQSIGAIQIRSDLERKRLFGLDALADSESATAGGIYTPAAGERTYDRLLEIAQTIVDADFCVIVDAAFLQRAQRRPFLELTSARSMVRIVVDCSAPLAELERRIAARRGDASEADIEVLRRQIKTRQTLEPDETALVQVVSVGTDGLSAAQIDSIQRMIAG